MNKAGKVIELVLSGAFYLVSTAFTFLLFVELGSSSLLFQIIFGTVAIILEGGKAVLWIQGIILKNPLLTILSLCAVCLSLGGSVGSAFMIVQSGDSNVLSKNPRIGEIQKSIEFEDQTITTWQDAINKLPKYYMDKAPEYGAEIEKAIARKQKLIGELANERSKGSKVNASALFDALEEGLGWSSTTVRFIFLLAISILIEAFAFSLSFVALKKPKRTRKFLFDGSISHLIDSKGLTLCSFHPLKSEIQTVPKKICASCAQIYFGKEDT